MHILCLPASPVSFDPEVDQINSLIEYGLIGLIVFLFFLPLVKMSTHFKSCVPIHLKIVQPLKQALSLLISH